MNLIPYNPVGVNGLRQPRRETTRAFQSELQAEGITATVRVERGAEIAAACGQLRTDVASDSTDTHTYMTRVVTTPE